MTLKFSVYQVSRRGSREKNEDRMGYCYTRESALFALADGMGGHPQGEVASQLALQTMAALFQRDARPTLADPLRFLHDAIVAGHHQLIRYATEKALMDTPRTTMVACVLQEGSAYWAHCGDSRLYLVRDGELIARTRDHSYSELQSALQAGASAGPRVNRNVLFTCLGSPSKPVVDSTGPTALSHGDRILLCSDGLWDAVEDDEIVDELRSRPISDAVPELVERALRSAAGHSDNVTVLAAEWESPDDFESTHGVSTGDLDDDAFASTIQGTALDAPFDDLDDAAIERSIREINEAIARSARRSQSSPDTEDAAAPAKTRT